MGHMMHFDMILIKQAHEKLKYLSQIPDAQQVLRETRDTYQQISQSIYYWKNIPENNQRLIRKQLKLANDIIPVRNVLGICKKEQWVDSFNIGSVMMMKPKLLEQRHRSDLLHIISAKCILEQVFYTSIAYFTIATEIRFKEVETDMKGLKQNQKIMRLSQNDFVKMCKVYHLKAIELAGRFVPTTSQYINHLILSFNKNYKSAMDPINQESILVDSRMAPSKCEQMSRKASQPIMQSSFKDERVLQKKNQIYLEDEIKRPPSRRVRSVRSNTRESGKNRQSTPVVQTGHRGQRFRSLQTYKKREEIKTFTFKFVKEIKQSNVPKKKQPKKPNHPSKKKITKSPNNY